MLLQNFEIIPSNNSFQFKNQFSEEMMNYMSVSKILKSKNYNHGVMQNSIEIENFEMVSIYFF